MSGDMAMLLRAKLHPSRFTAMSGKMAAIVGCLLDAEWTVPAIIEIVITSDGFALAVNSNLTQDLIGSVDDLERNWSTLLRVAELTDAEYAFAMLRYRDRITDWRRAAA